MKRRRRKLAPEPWLDQKTAATLVIKLPTVPMSHLLDKLPWPAGVDYDDSGLHDALEAHFSWGDNTDTLASKSRFREAISRAQRDALPQAVAMELRRRLALLPRECLIDLEW